jgi:hypothetical protein
MPEGTADFANGADDFNGRQLIRVIRAIRGSAEFI